MARSFNGSSDCIVTAGSKITGTSCTIAAWVYESSRLSGAGDPAAAHVLWSANTNIPSAAFNEVSSDNGDLKIAYQGFGWDDTVTTLPLQTWTHVASAADTSNYFLYMSGSQVFTTTTTNTTVVQNIIAAGAWSGEINTTAPSKGFFAGRIADIAVWNVRLTALEIAALAKGARPYTIRPLSLVSYQPFDGLQSPEPDLSGNQHNGTLTGTSLAFGPPYLPFTPRWPQAAPQTSAGNFFVMF